MLQTAFPRCRLGLEWVKPGEPATPDEGIVSALKARRARGPFLKIKGLRLAEPFLFGIVAIIIYLDESGDLGFNFSAPFRTGGSSRFLTIGALSVDPEKSTCPGDS